MAAELPARVEPHTGAQVVDFPWGAASTAISALTDAAATLDTQLTGRTTMVATLAAWQGSFRTEFDSALSRITSTASGLKETLTTLAGSIVTGAEEANSTQRTYNGEAIRREEAARNQPTPTPN